MALATISTDDLVRVVNVYSDALAEHREALNRLNVYPVPDGDTGTNMSLTLKAVLAELKEAIDKRAAPGAPLPQAAGGLRMDEVAHCLSHGSLMGARGNSGVILSQVLRGMSSSFRDAAARRAAAGSQGEALGPEDLVDALSQASASAYAAVSNPVEGTILTVAGAAARGAEQALAASHCTAGGASSLASAPGQAAPGQAAPGPGAEDHVTDLERVLWAAREAASRALLGTTRQLPALQAAGVVDAGGAGLLLLLDSLLHVVAGSHVEAPLVPEVASRASTGQGQGVNGLAAAGAPSQGPSAHALGSLQEELVGSEGGTGRAAAGRDVSELRYEVMFFLEAPDEAIPALRSVWAGCGGSIVIVGGDGLYNCHIHTDDVGQAIEAAIEIGRPRQIRVTDLADQVEEERWVREAVSAVPDQAELPRHVNCAVVAVCAGEGIRRIFVSLGASRVVSGGQSANPSTEEILEAIAGAPAEQVLVLPNNPNVVAVAEQAAAHSLKKVRVVPTPGVPEGFAAMLAYDPETDVDTNVDNMAAAAARVVAGEVVRASRDATTPVGRVEEGDWLGLGRDGIKVVTPALSPASDAAVALLGELLGEAASHEIVTVIEGADARPSDTRRIVGWLSDSRPALTVEVHHGGQPVYPYLFSIE